MSVNTERTMETVVVAGMGPVGMVAALKLAQMGHQVLVLEAGATLSDESRESTIHPSTLELLEELGVVDDLLAVGLEAPVFQYRERNGTVLSEMDMGLLKSETKYPYRIQSEQDNLTRIIQGLVVLFVGADLLILYIWRLRRKLKLDRSKVLPQEVPQA